ncbi:MAG: hypothetical protein AB7F89_24465, partial [Pirellulaceae bacterium]
EQWAAHDFDLRRLVSWLVRCEPFQRASGERIPSPPAAPGTGDPELAALFDRYYESTGAADAPPRRALLAAQQQKDADPAAAAARVNPGTTVPRKGGPVVASPELRAAVKDDSALTDPVVVLILSSGKLSRQQKAEHLFLMAVHRLPTKPEMDALNALLEKAGEDSEPAYRAIWNALAVP